VTKRIVYVMPDRILPDHFGHSHEIPGNVEVGIVSEELVAQMMGAGGVIRESEMEGQIDKHVAAGISREIATAYVEGITFGGLSEDEALTRIYEKDKPQSALAVHIIDDTQIPADHVCESSCELFDAWEWTDKVIVNMPKARGVHMNVIRVVRNAELVKEDLTFMRAVEDGDTDAQATIKTKKQTLRDIPQTFDLTTDNDTPEELKAKWPAELPTRE